jgi:hypothetical protein
MKAELPHLLLAVDLGGSGTKIVGGIQGKEGGEKAVIMMPHCIQVKNRDELLFDLDFTEHKTWVKIEGVGYAVGNLAATKFNATNKLKPAKFTTAVPKICAAIAVFTQLFRLPAKFNLSITFVLPPAEWEQKKIVIERLQIALKDFETPKGKIKPKLLSIFANPEGMGVLLGQGLDLKEFPNVTTIMLGHRNASIFTTKFSVMSHPQTSDLGFHTVLKDIGSKTGYKLDELILPIANCMSGISYLKSCKKIMEEHIAKLEIETGHKEQKRLHVIVDEGKKHISSTELKLNNHFQSLLKCSGIDRDIEKNILIETIDKSMLDYTTKLIDWLGENMDSKLSRICLCGGTSNFMIDEIKPFLYEQLIDKNEKWLLKHAPLPENAKKISGLTDRYHDIYCLYLQLQKDVVSSAVTVSV